MDAATANSLIIVGGLLVIALRIGVVLGYVKLTLTVILTMILPTVGLAVLMVRVLITRHTDLISPVGWGAASVWGIILLTQLGAAVHIWLPRPAEDRGVDAQDRPGTTEAAKTGTEPSATIEER